MKTLFFLLSLIFTHAFANTPKNLIYIIADGMGPSVVTATRIYSQGSKGQIELDKFKQIGLVKTYSSNDYVTDSAAAGTALATGHKTFNKAVGIDENKKALKNILDYATEKKLLTGIVTTATITHATPASFYAHHHDRDEEKLIANQLLNSKLDFILGGGAIFFDSKLLGSMLNKGWSLSTSKNDLVKMGLDKKVLGLFSPTHIPYNSSRSKKKYKGPSLTEMVQWSIKRFKDKKVNFALIVEAARIDHALHDNKTKKALEEAVELNEMIKSLRAQIGEDTLVIVTSDHDTGGLAINGYGEVDKVNGKEFLGKNKANVKYLSYATGPGKKNAYKTEKAFHTAADVLIFSEGHGSENFGGVMNNTEIFDRILKSFNWNK